MKCVILSTTSMMRNPEVGTMLTNYYIVSILYFDIVQAKQNHIVSLLSLLHVDLFQYTQPITNNSLQQFARIFCYLSFWLLWLPRWLNRQSGNLGRHYSHSVERERLRPSERSRPLPTSRPWEMSGPGDGPNMA